MFLLPTKYGLASRVAEQSYISTIRESYRLLQNWVMGRESTRECGIQVSRNLRVQKLELWITCILQICLCNLPSGLTPGSNLASGVCGSDMSFLIKTGITLWSSSLSSSWTTGMDSRISCICSSSWAPAHTQMINSEKLCQSKFTANIWHCRHLYNPKKKKLV